MAVFTQKDIDKISACLKPQQISWEKEYFRLKLSNPKEKRWVTLEIYPETTLGKRRGSMLVVYSGNSHLQLHSCSGYVISEELGEITFVSESEGRISGLVVEREAACSLYANVNRDLISGDFTRLGVEVMLSGVALSLAEDLLDQKNSSKKKKKR
ncbi:MAG: hypothetical protein A2142_00490 [candidate division Zixibacteria bacterium RBG_16_48_11]|nr:MAG: hypothetical protein A2142_00490 [candidate division Zixibacteria bacterium RBG_16_48_11]